MLGGWPPPGNGQDQTFQSGDYCYSFTSVAKSDEVHLAITFVFLYFIWAAKLFSYLRKLGHICVRCADFKLKCAMLIMKSRKWQMTDGNEYLRRMRELLETKLYRRNLIKGINTSVVPLIKYSGPFLKWTREELKQMDLRTRKLMTMEKASQKWFVWK